jgi:hypothetical protein
MNGMNSFGIEKNPFGQRRLAGIDMCAYTYIANFLIIDLHFPLLPS